MRVLWTKLGLLTPLYTMMGPIGQSGEIFYDIMDMSSSSNFDEQFVRALRHRYILGIVLFFFFVAK